MFEKLLRLRFNELLNGNIIVVKAFFAVDLEFLPIFYFFGGIEKVCNIFRMLLPSFGSLKSFGTGVEIRGIIKIKK